MVRCGRDMAINCGCTFRYCVTIIYNKFLGFTLHPTSPVELQLYNLISQHYTNITARISGFVRCGF